MTQLATIRSTDTQVEIMSALNGRSSKKKIAALEKIRTLPEGHEYKDEVKMIASCTVHREVYLAAKTTLWQLDPQAYVQIEKVYPFAKV